MHQIGEAQGTLGSLARMVEAQGTLARIVAWVK